MVDKNEAPEGYEAIEEQKKDTYTGCAFITDDDCSIKYADRICTDCKRKDGASVIFIKKPVEEEGISGSLRINIDFVGVSFSVNAYLEECHQGGYSPFNKYTIDQQYLAKENVTSAEIKAMVTKVINDLFSGKGVINAEA